MIDKLAIKVLDCIQLLINNQGQEKYTEALFTSDRLICKGIQQLQTSPCNEVYLRSSQFIQTYLSNKLADFFLLDEDLELLEKRPEKPSPLRVPLTRDQ